MTFRGLILFIGKFYIVYLLYMTVCAVMSIYRTPFTFIVRHAAAAAAAWPLRGKVIGYHNQYGEGTGRCTFPYHRLTNLDPVRSSYQEWYGDGTPAPAPFWQPITFEPWGLRPDTRRDLWDWLKKCVWNRSWPSVVVCCWFESLPVSYIQFQCNSFIWSNIYI